MKQICVNRCFDRTRRNRVDSDLAWGELDRQVSRQHLDAPLARAIRGKVREGQLFVHRADVDDFSRTSGLPKVAHHRLRGKEHALQIDVQNGVEILFGHVPEISAFLKPRVVDENVDLSEARHRLRDEPLPIGNLANVRLGSSRTAFRGGGCFPPFVPALPLFSIKDYPVLPLPFPAPRRRPSHSLISRPYSRPPYPPP